MSFPYHLSDHAALQLFGHYHMCIAAPVALPSLFVFHTLGPSLFSSSSLQYSSWTFLYKRLITLSSTLLYSTYIHAYFLNRWLLKLYTHLPAVKAKHSSREDVLRVGSFHMLYQAF